MPLVNMQAVPAKPTILILDTLAGSNGVDVNTSLVYSHPSVVQVEPTPAATIVAVQGRINPAAAWATIQTIAASTVSPTLVTMLPTYNFVRAVRTGAGNVTVFAQD
ncbi:MAG: hypothetical protein R8M45_07480 [Ghiorsea sp.]